MARAQPEPLPIAGRSATAPPAPPLPVVDSSGAITNQPDIDGSTRPRPCSRLGTRYRQWPTKLPSTLGDVCRSTPSPTSSTSMPPRRTRKIGISEFPRPPLYGRPQPEGHPYSRFRVSEFPRFQGPSVGPRREPNFQIPCFLVGRFQDTPRPQIPDSKIPRCVQIPGYSRANSRFRVSEASSCRVQARGTLKFQIPSFRVSEDPTSWVHHKFRP